MGERDDLAEVKELPRYKCHKVVHAMELERVEPMPMASGGGVTLFPKDESYQPIVCNEEYLCKHRRLVESRGYYVVYEDGYESWSPTEAFEEGYTLIDDD